MADMSLRKGHGLKTTVIVLWIVALAALGATAAVALVGRDGGGRVAELQPASELEVYGEVPAFTMTNRDGRTVTKQDLLGSPWVADFIFTQCKAVCPIMTLRMSQLQSAIADLPELADVKLVSMSVDPANDTPEVLAEYASRYGADADRWLFLTGASQPEVWKLVEEGFQLPLEQTPENEAMPISHSTRFVLVDAEGQIRGYYNTASNQDQADLVEALRRLESQR